MSGYPPQHEQQFPVLLSDLSRQHYPVNISELPKSWKVVTIGEAIPDIQSGFSSGDHSDGPPGVIHLRPMNVDREGRLSLDHVKYVLDTDGPRIGNGHILFNNTNSRELVGKTTAITMDQTYAFSNHMTRLRPPTGVSSRLAALQLHYLWMTGYFRHLSTQHVNQASISVRTLASRVPFLLPPAAEQERIVAKLDAALAKVATGVAATRRALDRLYRYRAAVLHAAISGKLTVAWRKAHPTEETGTQLLDRLLAERRIRWEEAELERLAGAGTPTKNGKLKKRYAEPTPVNVDGLPELPSTWQWSTLEAITDIKSGMSVSQNRVVKNSVSVPYLRVANVLRGRLNLSEIKSIEVDSDKVRAFMLEPEDILFTEGGDRDKLGRGWIWEGQIPSCIHQNHVFRARLIDRSAFDARLISHWGNTFGQQFFMRHGTQSTNLASINRKVLARLPIPIIPVAEQRVIVQELDKRLAAAQRLEAALNQQIDRAHAARQALFREAFTGKLVPQNPDDEPASALLGRIHASNEAETNKPKAKRMSKSRQTKVDTLKDLEALIDRLGNSVTPEYLLHAAGLGDDVEQFFDLLREGRNAGTLRVPTGTAEAIVRIQDAH